MSNKKITLLPHPLPSPPNIYIYTTKALSKKNLNTLSVVEIGPFPTRKNSIDPDTHREPAWSSYIVRLLRRFHTKRSPHRRALVRIGQFRVSVLNSLEIYDSFGWCRRCSSTGRASVCPVRTSASSRPRLFKSWIALPTG